MAISEALLGTSQQWLRAERARRPGVIPTHGVGANLLRIIREQPGIHFRALGRQAGLTSSGQLRHHLDRLADLGAIAEVKDGRFSRFFAGGDENPDHRARQARLSRPVPNLIARLLSDRPMSRTELRRRLGCADSTLGYHLNRLVQVGDIQRRIGPSGHEYALADPTVNPPELPWRVAPGTSPAPTSTPLAATYTPSPSPFAPYSRPAVTPPPPASPSFFGRPSPAPGSTPTASPFVPALSGSLPLANPANGAYGAAPAPAPASAPALQPTGGFAAPATAPLSAPSTPPAPVPPAPSVATATPGTVPAEAAASATRDPAGLVNQ